VLYRKNSAGGWTLVARSEGITSEESITYTTSVAGTYRWRVFSYSGAGSFAFGMQRP
jgi:hypothetical protein